jgi:hypothetical protein
MSELFDAAKNLTYQKDLEAANHRASYAKFEQERRRKFESLTPMVAGALYDIGLALYGRVLFFDKFALRTVRYGQEANDSYVGWHLCRPHGTPGHAIISVSLDGSSFEITTGHCGIIADVLGRCRMLTL